MSAPPGRSRGGGRGRASPNQGRGRDARNGVDAKTWDRQPPRGPASRSNVNNERRSRQAPRQPQGSQRQPKKPSKSASQAHTNRRKLSQSDDRSWRNPMITGNASYKAQMNDLFQKLKLQREEERKEAIRRGVLADPDKPTSLANAITPVGTCQDMCPEFERVERIVQQMVDGCEKELGPSGTKVPWEEVMVKRFRRSAAGYDEQLPSDIRPPAVLKRTLDYLMRDIVGGSESLSSVQKFVWDRTRGIRNDFSIQQVTKIEDIRLAIECFERIARYHILVLHQLSRSDLRDDDFDHYQEREQLNNTLLSLMYYYDDSRQRFSSPNEAEFRSYCIIFEIQNSRPDLEDRIQNWPDSILKDQRVQTALEIHAAASTSSLAQGPLTPKTPFTIGQGNASRFWNLLRSNATSYLTACVAEMYFGFVRTFTIETIWKAYKAKRGGSSNVEDWTLKDLCSILGFDGEVQTSEFCEDHGLQVVRTLSGELSVNLSSHSGATLSDSNPRRKQLHSRTIVEIKRLERSLPAIIDGFSAAECHAKGYLEESSDVESVSGSEDENLFIDGESDAAHNDSDSRSPSPANDEATQSHPAFEFKLPQFGSMFGKPSVNTNALPQLANGSGKLSSPSVATKDQASKPFSELFGSKENSEKDPFDFHAPPQPVKSLELSKLESTPKSPPDSTKSLGSLFTDAAAASVRKPNPFVPPQDSKSLFSPKESGNSEPSTNESNESQGSVLQNSFAPKGQQTIENVSQHQWSPSTKSPFNSPLGTAASGQAKPQTSLFATPSVIQSTNEQSKPSPSLSQKSQVEQERALTSKPFKPPPPSGPTSTQTPTLGAFTFPHPSSDTSTPSSSLPANSVLSPQAPQPSKDFTQTSPRFGGSSVAPKQTLFASPGSSNVSPQPLNDKSLDVTATTASKNALRPQQDPSPEVRSKALEKVSSIIMTEVGGLLEQFIEFTVTPIIRSTIMDFQDQKSWARARKCRTVILAKKYFARWKSIAWNLGLKRAARERRKLFARSMMESSQRSNPSSGFATSSQSAPDVAPNMPTSEARNPASPVSQLLAQGRSLLGSVSQAGTKRKRESSTLEVKDEKLSRSWQQHKRSNTLATSTMSAPPHSNLHSKLRQNLVSTRAGDGSLLGDTLMRQARRKAPDMKSDTTKTDYFTLKARGIDPDTPIVPRTKSRPESPVDKHKVMRPGNTGLHKETKPTSRPAVKGTGSADDDEALFASIKSLRSTLAESTSWFQSERQSLERSVTPQRGLTPGKNETPAERRLRELKERGRTPTRTEIRQRSSAHLQSLSSPLRHNEFHLDGNSNHHEVEAEQPSKRPPKMGFAALAQSRKTNGIRHSETRSGSEDSSALQKGSSVEDAIEL